ncbi:MAG TPA: DapH/DapD/GlmU-related protein [Cyclobacteriaceae bacterium]|nr:DapH/DapD/GlmU-related protein [Cyclobacteriaceae bacterium]
MDNPVIIFGANYLGKAAKEIFESNLVVVYGFLDDNKSLHNTQIGEVTILGETDDDGFLKLIGKKCEAFVASDDNRERKALVNMLNDRRKVMPVNAVHQQAYISPTAGIAHGNFVDMGVKIGHNVSIGNHCIIHAGAILSTEVSIGNFVQVGAGSIINPEVKIEDEVFIGSGVVIVAGLTIGKGARVGAGSVVISSVKAGETVFGNPAQKLNN